MKKLSILVLASILCIAVLSGCGKEKEPETTYTDTTVYGTWAEDFFDSGYIFNEDGTGYDTFWNLSFTFTANGERMRLAYDDEIWGVSEYKYTVEGDTLTMIRVTEGEEDSEPFVYYRKGGAPSGGGSSTEDGGSEDDNVEDDTDF